MRTALGLNVAPAASFAAVVTLDGPGGLLAARPRELVISPAPAPDDDASIVDAARAAIALAERREGETPAAVALAHPLAWDARRVRQLRGALTEAGMTDIAFVSAAVAAVVAAESSHPVEANEFVAVVETRSGGWDVVALRKDGEHSFHAIGSPRAFAGVEEDLLDEALLALVAAQLEGGIPEAEGADAATAAALVRLHRAVRTAREHLCDVESTVVGVRLPGQATVVEVDRSAFQDAVAPLLRPTIPALRAAISEVGDAGSPALVLLTGTAAPTPLLAELLAVGSAAPVLVADARHGGSYGAALAAAAGRHPAAKSGATPAAVPMAAVEPEAAAPELTPVSAVTHVNAAPAAVASDAELVSGGDAVTSRERRRRPLIVALWPVAAAAAALVVLGGAAATGALNLTPTSSHTNEPGQTTPNSSSHGTSSATKGPDDVTGGAQGSDESAPGKKSSKKPGSGSGSGSSDDSSSSATDSPSATPSDGPSDTPTPTPSDTPSDTPSPDPSPTQTDAPSDPPADPPADPPSDPPADPDPGP